MSPLEFIQAAKLRQYPPQKRTMNFRSIRPEIKQRARHISPGGILWEHNTVSVPFPWLSFGGLRVDVKSQVAPNDILPLPLVFAHDRPWTSFPDALKILRILPRGFHATMPFGFVCMGDDCLEALSDGLISVEDAFWFTANVLEDHTIDLVKFKDANEFLKNTNKPGFGLVNCYQILKAAPLGIIPCP